MYQKIISRFNKIDLNFLFARIISVLYKPFFIYIISLININDGNIAATIQILVTVTLLLVTFDSGKEFYINKQLNNYKIRLLLLLFAGIIFIIFYYFTYQPSLKIIFLLIFGFFFEKCFDEICRLFLIKENFEKWSKIVLTRLSLSILVLLYFYFFRDQYSLFLTFLLIYILNFVVIKFYDNDLKLFSIKISKKILILNLNFLYNKSVYFLLIFFAAIYSYMDRFFALLTQNENLAIYVILISSFSVSVFMIDTFYLSMIRKKILSIRYTYKNLLKKNFLILFAVSLLLGLISFIITVWVIKNSFEFKIDFVLFSLIFFYQSISIITSLLREFIFWGLRNYDKYARIESFVACFFLLIVIFIYFLKPSFIFVIFLSILIQIARLIFYINFDNNNKS
jgi:hypothetical protein